MSDVLREPKGRFQEVVRRLAEAAMSVTHHDAADHEPGYIHEVQAMERRFTNILRGKLFAKAITQPPLPEAGDVEVDEWQGPLTGDEQGMIDAAWEKHKAAEPPKASGDVELRKAWTPEERAEDMLKTAKELRENSNGNPSVIQQAIFWEHKAAALSRADTGGKEAAGEGEYRVAEINDTDRPWAVINSQGPFGDDIVAGNIRDHATAVKIMATLQSLPAQPGVDRTQIAEALYHQSKAREGRAHYPPLNALEDEYQKPFYDDADAVMALIGGHNADDR